MRVQRGVAFRRGLYVSTRPARRRDAVLLIVLLVAVWGLAFGAGWEVWRWWVSR